MTLGRTAVSAALIAAATFFMIEDTAEAIGAAVVVAVVIVWTQRTVSRGITVHTRFLPLMRFAAPVATPLIAFAILMTFDLLDFLPLSLGETAVLCALGALNTLLLLVGPQRDLLRLAVVGSPGTANDLRDELQAQDNRTFLVVGHISWDERQTEPDKEGIANRALGRLGDLANAIAKERLDLLLVSPAVPRMAFFEEIEATCAHANVRVLELSSFYERTFGHVPLRAINAAWFQWVMHPRFSSRISDGKRVLDLTIAALAAIIALPIIVLLGLILRLQGGPAFYRQIRIGEGGKPFEILKLRSMRIAPPDTPARWSSDNDDRVTRIGAFMRRTHLDELPQLLNVLKGEMSIVGPRPEQPGFVEELEESVPFYSRRHVARPGITGWAQVGCGYAGSHEGTLWKLSHDLYYLKHRSVIFDLLVIGETLRMLVSRSQFPPEQSRLPFVHGIDHKQSVPASPDPVRSGPAHV